MGRLESAGSIAESKWAAGRSCRSRVAPSPDSGVFTRLSATCVKSPTLAPAFYTPSATTIENAPDSVFRRYVNERYKLKLKDYWELQEWSTRYMDEFWRAVWA